MGSNFYPRFSNFFFCFFPIIGDFFDKSTIPEAGLYILSHVLVDFGDQMGRKILSNLYGCLKEGELLNLIRSPS